MRAHYCRSERPHLYRPPGPNTGPMTETERETGHLDQCCRLSSCWSCQENFPSPLITPLRKINIMKACKPVRSEKWRRLHLRLFSTLFWFYSTLFFSCCIIAHFAPPCAENMPLQEVILIQKGVHSISNWIHCILINKFIIRYLLITSWKSYWSNSHK